VPPYSPPSEDWDGEDPGSSSRADGFGPTDMDRFGVMPSAAPGIGAPGGISFADLVRTISPAAEPGVWSEDNSALFWIPDDPRATLAPSLNDYVRTIDQRANPDIWRGDNSAPRYAGWNDPDRHSVPYDPRAAALGAFHIPGLPEDAADWGGSPLSVDEIPPVQLAGLITRMLNWFILRRHGLGDLKPFKLPDPPRDTIYRNGGWSPSNFKVRPGEKGTSWRGHLSEPIPKKKQPVFTNREYIEADPSKLPPGSVIWDDIPPGHVTVEPLPYKTLKDAVRHKKKWR
jgi:hypothetical protein